MTFTSSPVLVGPLVAALAQRRRSLGIKQRELDDKAGFADGLIEKFESGVRIPSIQSLTWWASALGCKLGLVLDDQAGLAARDWKKAAALVHLSNGRGVREIARMLELPRSTVSYWRRAVQRLDSKKRTPSHVKDQHG